MSELRQLLSLWEEARASGEEVVLATVVRVEGSSYRKPGARMLITKGGRRCGMVSGGCLEAELSRKAFWLTKSGPAIQRYETFFDDDNPSPQKTGCGGTVYVLFERADSAGVVLEAIRRGAKERFAFALLTVTRSSNPRVAVGSRFALQDNGALLKNIPTVQLGSEEQERLLSIAQETIKHCRSEYMIITTSGYSLEIFAEYVAPPPALFVFGAGDDAIPVVDLARMLGWHVTVADMRAHLLNRLRFPDVGAVVVLENLLTNSDLASDQMNLPNLALEADTSAVIMTHSYMQDRALLKHLLRRELCYLGILGPRLRTARLVSEVASEIDISRETCLSRLHSPIGLDLGANSPTIIALSIVAEIQSAIHSRFATDLRSNADLSVATSL